MLLLTAIAVKSIPYFILFAYANHRKAFVRLEYQYLTPESDAFQAQCLFHRIPNAHQIQHCLHHGDYMCIKLFRVSPNISPPNTGARLSTGIKAALSQAETL